MVMKKLDRKSMFLAIIKQKNAKNSTKMDIALMELDVSFSIYQTSKKPSYFHLYLHFLCFL